MNRWELVIPRSRRRKTESAGCRRGASAGTGQVANQSAQGNFFLYFPTVPSHLLSFPKVLQLWPQGEYGGDSRARVRFDPALVYRRRRTARPTSLWLDEPCAIVFGDPVKGEREASPPRPSLPCLLPRPSSSPPVLPFFLSVLVFFLSLPVHSHFRKPLNRIPLRLIATAFPRDQATPSASCATPPAREGRQQPLLPAFALAGPSADPCTDRPPPERGSHSRQPSSCSGTSRWATLLPPCRRPAALSTRSRAPAEAPQVSRASPVREHPCANPSSAPHRLQP
ncbi:hypothetical protein Taro_043641, partial [Colocasia esculenta]|nr:hypothetical protein [Colocasia esculenta]